MGLGREGPLKLFFYVEDGSTDSRGLIGAWPRRAVETLFVWGLFFLAPVGLIGAWPRRAVETYWEPYIHTNTYKFDWGLAEKGR